MIMSTALIMFMKLYFVGMKQLLIPVSDPIGALIGHMGARRPMYNVIKSDVAIWAIQLSGALAIYYRCCLS